MKTIIGLLLIWSSFTFAGVLKYETLCKGNDCFKNGWTTIGTNFRLETECKKQDCSRYGWSSVANDNSTYEVNCQIGGCFKMGWHSVQNIKGKKFHDSVTCKFGSCLNYGWTVATGYDLMGGNVQCYGNDCSKYGGTSFWRGRPSQTACYSKDCYHRGWTLLVY